MVSPVSLSAAGVVVAGTAAITLGLAHEPAPLPADVVAPVRFAPTNAVGPTVGGHAHRAGRSSDGATAIPNRPVVFPEHQSGGARDRSRSDDRTPAAGVQPSAWSTDTPRSSHGGTANHADSAATQVSGPADYGSAGRGDFERGR